LDVQDDEIASVGAPSWVCYARLTCLTTESARCPAAFVVRHVFRVNDGITPGGATVPSLTGGRADRGHNMDLDGAIASRSIERTTGVRNMDLDAAMGTRDLGTFPAPSRHTLRPTCHAPAGTVERVQPTPRHREVEARFRALVVESELPTPDRVEYEPESVLFLWDGPRVAVFVDFDGRSRSPPGSAG
jgi:hypothetical protein